MRSVDPTSLGPRIAQGRTAEIYLWGEGQVVKLFRDWVSAGAAEREARNARAAYAAGVLVPAVGEIVEVEGRLGLVCERAEGPSLLASIKLWQPWTIVHCAHRVAELHVELHRHAAPEGLSSQREHLRSRLHQTPDPRLREAACEALEELPDGDVLCHHDFQPPNIVMTARGPMIIDWDSAARGNPDADMARTWTSFMAASAPAWADPLCRWFAAAYRARYLRLRPIDPAHVQRWCAVLAAARMSDGMPEVVARSRALAEKGLLR